jgi:hypothetical protein
MHIGQPVHPSVSLAPLRWVPHPFAVCDINKRPVTKATRFNGHRRDDVAGRMGIEKLTIFHEYSPFSIL